MKSIVALHSPISSWCSGSAIVGCVQWPRGAYSADRSAARRTSPGKITVHLTGIVSSSFGRRPSAKRARRKLAPPAPASAGGQRQELDRRYDASSRMLCGPAHEPQWPYRFSQMGAGHTPIGKVTPFYQIVECCNSNWRHKMWDGRRAAPQPPCTG